MYNGGMKRGFTIVELLIVLIIIGILGGVAVASISSERERAGALRDAQNELINDTDFELAILSFGSAPAMIWEYGRVFAPFRDGHIDTLEEREILVDFLLKTNFNPLDSDQNVCSHFHRHFPRPVITYGLTSHNFGSRFNGTNPFQCVRVDNGFFIYIDLGVTSRPPGVSTSTDTVYREV